MSASTPHVLPNVFESSVYASTPVSFTERAAKFLRPTSSFVHLECTAGPYAVLTEPELKVVLEVVLMTLNALPELPRQGTIRLAGQRHGHAELQPVFSADLCKGAFLNPSSPPHLASDVRTSQALAHAAQSSFDYDTPGFVSVFCPLHTTPMTAVYYHGDYRTLILNATYGRFLASIDTNLRSSDDEDYVHFALAATLSCLRPHDRGLQQSLKDLCPLLEEVGDLHAVQLIQTVRELFVHPETHPVLRSWHNCDRIESVLRTPADYFELPRDAPNR